MKIPVAGFDPSLTNWGIAEAILDLETGFLDTPKLTVVRPRRLKGKQVRQNSKDLHEAVQLTDAAYNAASNARAVFVEVPHGSQSARSMASYGICVGILGALRMGGISLIEVSAEEVKVALTGNKNASKELMIATAKSLYPEAKFPEWRGEEAAITEHVADAIGAIHAGVRTPVFQQFMSLLERK